MKTRTSTVTPWRARARSVGAALALLLVPCAAFAQSVAQQQPVAAQPVPPVAPLPMTSPPPAAAPPAAPPPATDAPTAAPAEPPTAVPPATPAPAPPPQVRLPWPRSYPVIPGAVQTALPAPAAPAPPPVAPPPPIAVPPPAGAQPIAPPSQVAGPQQATPADTEEPSADEPESGQARRGPCALQQFCLGPLFTLGLVNLLGVGLHARYGDYVGFGFDYQFTPTVSRDGADANAWLLTFDGRVYPTGGALFLSAGFAYQQLDVEGTYSTPDLTVHAAGNISVPLLKLGVGVMGRSGFVMGIDLAIEIPLSSADVELTSQRPTDPNLALAYDIAENEAEDFANDALHWLPFLVQLNLVRVGYLF